MRRSEDSASLALRAPVPVLLGVRVADDELPCTPSACRTIDADARGACTCSCTNRERGLDLPRLARDSAILRSSALTCQNHRRLAMIRISRQR